MRQDKLIVDDEKKVLLLKKTKDSNIVIVRGLDVNSQISSKPPNEDTGHCRITISLSQDTETMPFPSLNLSIRCKKLCLCQKMQLIL